MKRWCTTTQVVDHGSTLGEIADPTDPSGHEYTFGGWFYEKSGKKGRPYSH